MAEPFLAEIRIMSFNFPPKGWALCNGQLLPINQNQALFSLLGTTYGGDGRVNFGLPNLQGRVPMHTGQGHTLGERGGTESHAVSISEFETLFNLIGTTYGGDGQETFNLPDLRGRVPIHMGNNGVSTYTIAENGGVEEVTLSVQQTPAHTHALAASTSIGTQSNPGG